MMSAGQTARERMRPFRAVITFIGFLLIVLFVWEGLKILGGDPWRADGRVIWNPPLRLFFASDLNLPHVWSIVAVLGQPAQRNSPLSLAQFLAGAAASTWREAAIGFVAGGFLGLALAIVFVESEFAERAFVPYVIASQTIPILALSPMIVQAFGQSTVSVAIVATYLTFFPMTIAGIRGLRSPDPRALELMQSYAASRWTVLWKVRFPASLPYLFTALKISASAALVGAIIGEGSGSFPEGLGRAIVNFNEQYITFPAKLWAAILVAAMVGIAFYGIVRVAEYLALRNRPRASE